MHYAVNSSFKPLYRAAVLLRRLSLALVILSVLALSAIVTYHYQAQVDQLHEEARERIANVQTTLSRYALATELYLKEVEQEYLRYNAKEPFSLSTHIWFNSPSPPASLRDRLASILDLIKQKRWSPETPRTVVLLDQHKQFFASDPAMTEPKTIERIEKWAQQLTPLSSEQMTWKIFYERTGGPCNCLATYLPLALPFAQHSLLVEILPLSWLKRQLSGEGWFALLAGSQLIYTSSAVNPALLQNIQAPSTADAIHLQHIQGEIAVSMTLRPMPWTLVYLPSPPDSLGAELSVLLWCILEWCLGILALAWGYVNLQKLILRPTVMVLVILADYQQQLEHSHEEMVEAKKQAEDASLARTMFLATMSHEIRTPLNGIIAMLELVERSQLNTEQRQQLAIIKTSSNLLLHVIGDILDFTKIQSGKVVFSYETIALQPFIEHILTAHRAPLNTQGKSLTLKAHYHQITAQTYVWLDPYHFSQVLNNLLSNAIKFTEQGQVILSLDWQNEVLTVSVEDQGIGMSQDQLARLFQPFEQAQATTVRHFGGSGLGLAIIKGLVEQAKGSITVESTPGVGSTFRLSWPCSLASPPSLAASEQNTPVNTQTRPGTILVVEDHPINQATLRAQLNTLGVGAHFVCAGKEALERLEQRDNIDLVLTDISMPDMDGFELAQQLQHRYPDLPVVALSAHAFEEHVIRSKEVGMAAYLTKPVTLDMLRDMLARFNIASDDTLTPNDSPSLTAHADIQSLVTLFNGDLLQVQALIQRFLQCDSEDLQKLKQSWQTKNRQNVATTAHRMGGAAQYIDPHYAQRLYELESCCHEEQTEEQELSALIDDIIAYSEALEKECQRWLDSREQRTEDRGQI